MAVEFGLGKSSFLPEPFLEIILLMTGGREQGKTARFTRWDTVILKPQKQVKDNLNIISAGFPC